MKNQNLPSFSTHKDGTQEFNFKAPSSWAELSEDQLRYVLSIMSTFQDHTVVKCYLLARFCGLTVHKYTRTGWKCSVKCDESGENGDAKTGKVRKRVLYISAAEILSLLKNFDFIDSFTDFRPLQVASDVQLTAVNSLLHEISFYDYLNIEKNYQLFMLKQEDRFLLKMAHLMYRTAGGSSDETANFEPYELLGVFMWFSSVKEYFAANFPHFFRPAREGGELRREDILPAMQAQIRALTDGDVTKLQAVYNTDCWAALTELESQHFEVNDPEPWRNNGYNGKGNDGTIIKQQRTTGTHQASDKERKARAKAEKTAAAEARKREAEAKRKQKQAADSIKAETNELMANNAKAYAEGKKTYQQFLDDRQNIQIKGFAKLKQLYGAESNEYKQLLDNQVTVVKQHDAAILKMNEQSIERERLQKEASIKAQYNDANSAIYQNDIALDEAIYQNDADAMQKRLALYNEGSEEWLDLKAEMEQASLDHQLQMQEAYQNQLKELRQQFGKQDLQAQETMYLNGLDNLYKQGLIKEEEYQRMKLEISKQFAAQRAQIDADDRGAGSAQLKINDKSSEMVNSARAAAGESQSTGNATLGGYFSSQVENYQNTMEKLKELYGNDKQNHAAYMQAKAQVTSDFLKNLVEKTAVVYNGINGILSASSSYAQACSDLEQAKISKNYEKQIAAAGNNSKKKKKLEEKRDKELAAAKSKANKKAMKIEIAQAIASTAMSAINAYASAAAIPTIGWTLAPIAAGMATAAGMIQLAAIKKQHQAEAAGYYEGGYTGGNRYRKEAGVVHEGEFVANHNAVNNSSIRPALDLIDRAQRSNTVGSLTADDITRSLGQGGSTVVAPVVNVNNDNTEVRQSLDGVNAAVSRLTQTLDDGIEVEVPISGRRGLHRRLQDYQRILNNK